MCLMKFATPAEYQNRNLQMYSKLRLEIAGRLPNSRVEHIGSSAIPGAYSKGDLDIFVGVPKSDIGVAIRELQELGFKEKLDTLRTSELCMLAYADAQFDVAAQVVANGSEFEHFLKFRDLLSSSPSILKDYNALKLSCRKLSKKEYREKKSKFIEAVLHAH